MRQDRQWGSEIEQPLAESVGVSANESATPIEVQTVPKTSEKSGVTRHAHPMPTPIGIDGYNQEFGWIEFKHGRPRKDGTFTRYPRWRCWEMQNGKWIKSKPTRIYSIPDMKTEDDYVNYRNREENVKRLLGTFDTDG